MSSFRRRQKELELDFVSCNIIASFIRCVLHAFDVNYAITRINIKISDYYSHISINSQFNETVSEMTQSHRNVPANTCNFTYKKI